MRVEDNGLGVPPAAHGRIFERFFRAHTSLSIAGTGLGLSIVRAMVEGWGGQVRVTSRANGGTVFWFTAPAAPHSANGAVRAAPSVNRGTLISAAPESLGSSTKPTVTDRTTVDFLKARTIQRRR